MVQERPILDYLREARRLRARLGHDPALMHHRLRRLADRQPLPPEPKPQPTNAELFAQRVLESLDGPVLRYSRRVSLLKLADQMGIGRFEANLIIATVLHRMGSRGFVQQEQPAQPSPWPSITATVIAVQGGLLLALWWILS